MSNKKYFTLIHGDELHLPPNTKIIDSSAFSSLQDAKQVLDLVKTDADKYRLEVAQECETIKERGYADGYLDGYEEWTERLAAFEEQLNDLLKETQKLIIPVALKAAKKIVGREIELSEDTIVDIVASNLKAVFQHKKITIFVNKKELDTLEKNKPKLRSYFENLESLSIRPRDDIESGGCVIETEVGIINAKIEHRWHILEKAFEGLMKSAPETLKQE